MQRFLHRALAIAFVRTGDDQERAQRIRLCAVELTRLRELRPELDTAAMNLHWALSQLGDQEKANALTDSVVKEGRLKAPQPLVYFARQLINRNLYDAAIKLLQDAPRLSDYLGDEIGLERMRAYAGRDDVAGVVAAFVRRIGELAEGLDHAHFAFHKDVSMDAPASELARMLKHGAALEREFKALAEQRDAEGRRKMIYVVTLAGLYSRLDRPDDQVAVLADAIDEFKGVYGFRHYLSRCAYRILETGERDKPD